LPRNRAQIPTAFAAVAVAVAVSMGAAACESSAADRPAAGPVSASPSTAALPVTKWKVSTGPCVLLTEADATAALGADPGPGRSNAKAGLGQCDYGGDEGVLIQVIRHSQGKALFNQLNAKGLADGSMTPVDGIGDAAISSSVGVSAMIQFVKGTYFVTILLTPSGDAPALPPATDLARTVAARI
jgi:hypothetical protein